ncbi:MAG: hypothetical protein K2F87_03645 [Muribaculaceae bacterium]|nr:hypothetical protein [Muribaculaceae bacterium]
MKKPGSTCDYTQAKNDELVKAFYAYVGRTVMIDLDAIFRQIADSPASRFFISEERAYELVRRYRSSGKWDMANPLRVAMLDQIHSNAMGLMASDARLTLKDAVYEAVNSPAPKFYLTPKSCRQLIYKTIKERNLALRMARLGL